MLNMLDLNKVQGPKFEKNASQTIMLRVALNLNKNCSSKYFEFRTLATKFVMNGNIVLPNLNSLWPNITKVRPRPQIQAYFFLAA